MGARSEEEFDVMKRQQVTRGEWGKKGEML